MADSDEEYERRRSRDGGREKFRRERSDYDRNTDDRRKENWDSDRSRGGRSQDWGSRGSGDRGGRDPYGRDNRRREGYDRPEMNHPPQKRIRRDWEYDGGAHRPYPMHYGAQHMHRAPAPWPPQPHPEMPAHPVPAPHMESYQDPNQMNAQQRPGAEPDFATQPLMLTFKQFLGQQEDNISDQDAIKKYNTYKIDFKKQQINSFFLAHKDNEWFKTKFHPDDCARRKEITTLSLNHRLTVFKELFSGGQLDNVTVDTDKHEDLVKLLNTVIIKLEGGTELDLQSLDISDIVENETAAPAATPGVTPAVAVEPVEEEPKVTTTPTEDKTFTLTASPVKKKKKKSRGESKKVEEPLNLDEMTEEQIQLQKAAQEFSKTMGDKAKESKEPHYSYSGSESDSQSGSDDEPAPPGLDDDAIEDTPTAPVVVPPPVATKEDATENNEEKDTDTANVTEAAPPAAPPAKIEPRPLHKTQSIFLRQLAPSITKSEVEAVCKRYPGFMRVALQDPLPDKNFFRRGWVTFDRTVNIRDICWNLNNIRLRDCELNAIVNRELKQRVRPVAGITSQKQVIRQDIKLAAKLIMNLDIKWSLWTEDGDKNGEKTDTPKQIENLGFISQNPVLTNITHYLVDEGNFEEEELVGQTADDQPKDASSDIPIERDPELIRVLDRMILYLRVVHSVDYYSATEFPNEDEMPHRCGIMHARSHIPPTRMNQNDINEWMNNFDKRIKHFLTIREPLPEKDITELGRKDPEAEVEKFITANAQELGKDKWLCPLSGKKFKGPDFVRKHILNKHQEKIEEVKKEVAYFNNYLMDPKRPQLPEHPGNRPHAQPAPNAHPPAYPMPHYPGMMAYGHPRHPMMPTYPPHPHHPPYRGYPGRDAYRHDGPPQHRRPMIPVSRRGKDPRSIIDYRDLDAPDAADIF